jgi:hypothetical protein
MRDTKPQELQHLVESRSALPRGAFLFLKPANDFQTLALGIA